MKKIVIMLSTYNGEKYLDEQLNSLYYQNTSDFQMEVFTRDDGSKDLTTSIIKKWKKKININIINDNEKMGPAKSFWKLLNQAPIADYYAFMDQDDIWDKGKIKTAINAMSEEDVPTLWFSNCRIIDVEKRILSNGYQTQSPILTIPSQLICGSAQGCSMVFNRKAFEILKKNKIEEFPMHDLITMILILNSGRVIYEPQPYFSYRVHENNAVAKKGKSFFQKKKETYNNWFNEPHRNEISMFAGELINHLDIKDSEVKDFLIDLSHCKNNFKSRLRIIKNKLTKSTNKRALLAFKIKTLLGII